MSSEEDIHLPLLLFTSSYFTGYLYRPQDHGYKYLFALFLRYDSSCYLVQGSTRAVRLSLGWSPASQKGFWQSVANQFIVDKCKRLPWYLSPAAASNLHEKACTWPVGSKELKRVRKNLRLGGGGARSISCRFAGMRELWNSNGQLLQVAGMALVLIVWQRLSQKAKKTPILVAISFCQNHVSPQTSTWRLDDASVPLYRLLKGVSWQA